MKKLVLWLVGAVVIISLTGCETAKGVGKDIENTGENIQQGVDSIGK